MRHADLPRLLPAFAALCCACDGTREPPPSVSAAPASAVPAGSSATNVSATAKAGFRIVAVSPDAFFLYPLRGAAFVDAAGFLATLEAGALRQTPATMKGLEKGVRGKIVGAFPEGVWMLAGDTYKWSGDRWAAQQILRDGERLIDVAAWGDGRALAAIAMPHDDMRFLLVGGKPGIVMPGPGKPGSPPPTPPASGVPDGSATAPPRGAPPPGDAGGMSEDERCKVRMRPESVVLAGLPSGELFAAGYDCDEAAGNAAIVERWEPKQVRGVVDALPRPADGSGIDVRGALARSATEAYVFGDAGPSPYLAHFDGKAWSAEAVSFRGPITSMMAADDAGPLYAVAGALYEKIASGPWTELALPTLGGEELAPQAVWARAASDVWIAAATGKGEGALLRSGGAETPTLKLPARKEMTDMIATNRRFLATAACDRIFVHLTTIGPSKSDVPSAFPRLVEAFAGQPGLEGAKFLVEDDGANLYVGAQVPSLEIGRKLLSRFKEKNPKAVANVFCHEPHLVKKAIVLE